MAKEPEAGQVKTRLCPPLEPAQAASLYEAFLADTLKRVTQVGHPLRVYGAGSSMDRLGDLSRAAGADLKPQCAGHLGQRMAAAIQQELREFERVVVLGGDTPDLPIERIEDAVVALDKTPVCLGPATDGGYYLLAARDRVPHEILGADIPWGTPGVLDSSRAALSAAGTSYVEIGSWCDVDDVGDLTRLRERLAEDASIEVPHSRAALRELVRQGRL
jgi:rSAM/selenodomain-associated transferase 1